MAFRTYFLIIIGSFLVFAGTVIYYQASFRTWAAMPATFRPPPPRRPIPGRSLNIGDEILHELKDCASFRAAAPIYGKWLPYKQRKGGNLLEQNTPLGAVFHHGIFIKSGVTMTKRVKRHEDAKFVVPNIHHYAWYSDKTKTDKTGLRFHHYISILSAQKFNKPDCVYFWYEREPTGKLWEKLKKKLPNLIMVYREGPTSIYGRKVYVPEHKSDIIRLEAMLKYGGLYTDLDVIVVKPFTDLRVYDMTMGYESADPSRVWLCNGIMFGKPNATFMRIWHEQYKTFVDAQWGEHSVVLPARLAKEHPNLIHTEIDTMNRPNWEERSWLYNDGKIWDWSKNYAVHLWFRFHNIDHNPDDIKAIKTTMGQLFRYILYGKKDLISKNESVTAFHL